MNRQSEKIARLNDSFRRTFAGGKVVMTASIAALSEDEQHQIFAAVQGFEDFTEGDDPYGEHDFGATEAAGRKVFWKIDYYDSDLSGGSPDPADPAETTRVLTIMLAGEY